MAEILEIDIDDCMDYRNCLLDSSVSGKNCLGFSAQWVKLLNITSVAKILKFHLFHDKYLVMGTIVQNGRFHRSVSWSLHGASTVLRLTW